MRSPSPSPAPSRRTPTLARLSPSPERKIMGAEAEHRMSPSPAPAPAPPTPVGRTDGDAPPMVLGLQLSALIDHVARVDWSLLNRIPGDRGGSQQVPPPPYHTTNTHNSPQFLCSVTVCNSMLIDPSEYV